MSLIPFPVRSRHDGRLPLATLPPLPRLTQRRAAALYGDETGAATAEYVVATMAAVAFAGLLVVISRPEPTNCFAWPLTASAAPGAL